MGRGRLWVARGYGWRAVGGSNRDGGLRAAKERLVRERASEHGHLPSVAFDVFHRGDSQDFCTVYIVIMLVSFGLLYIRTLITVV